MSLLRQLWLVVLFSTVLAFLGGFAVNLTTARQYLEQQLLAQSTDNAASLALSMSQQSPDEATAELLVTALFDSGHFRLIRFEDVRGKVVVERQNNSQSDTAPHWFIQLMPLKVKPGIGMVSNGWNQAGRVVVVAHERFAYESLWGGALNFLMVMAVIGALTALAVTALIRWVRRPLDELMRQAIAIGERQFITITEPNVFELKQVVRTMNLMVDKVKSMFAEQTARVDELREAANRDAMTGLANRDFFMGRLRQALADEKAAAHGALLLIRLHDLVGINRDLGRVQADALIQQMARALTAEMPDSTDWLLARVNGTDFAVLAPGATSQQCEAWVTAAQQALMRTASARFAEGHNIAHSGVAFYRRGMKEGALLSATDQVLSAAMSLGANRYAMGEVNNDHAVSVADWRVLLDRAIAAHSFEVASFPALDLDGTLIHEEALLRLRQDSGNLMTAGQFMPMAARFGYLGQLDLIAIELACARVKAGATAVAVNISSASIHDKVFLDALGDLLLPYRSVCDRLWFEVNEAGLDGDYERLTPFSKIARQFGVKVGIEHFGRQMGRFPALYELHLDYIKIDGSFVRDIDQQPVNQQLVKAIVGIANAAGLMVMAEQVHTEAEWATLRSLGVNGATGPLATSRSKVA
jgi:diguanylate cyclase (GGDEF)-like protein